MEGAPPPAPAPAAPAAGADVPTREWLVPMAVLVVGMFMSVLDMSIVNVAIPTMQHDFGSSTDDIQWISNAYTLALGVVVPLSGWLGDRIGLTRTYLYGLVAFAAASALCGLAWNLESMVAFRILQAIPGGIIPVVTMTMVYHVIPPAKMGSAMGLYGLGIIFGPAIGPTLGGYLVEYLSWRLIFFINVPVGILGALAVVALLPAISSPGAARRLDWWGFLTIASGLFALLLACSKGPDWGWSSYRVLILMVAGVLAMALFVVIELEVDQPLIDLRVFRTWAFTNSLLLIGVLTVGLFAILFYLPLFMQENLHRTALHTGLVLLPEALTMAVAMPIAGRLYDRFGPRWPAVIGLTVASAGGFLLCGISPQMSDAQVILWTCVRAAGNGIAMMPIFTAGLAAIPAEYVSSGSPANNIVQRASAALGLAVMTVLFTARQAQMWADQAALLPGHGGPAAMRAFADGGRTSLLGYYQALQVAVTARALSDMFLIAAVLTAAGIGLAFLMRSSPQPVAAAPEDAGAIAAPPPVEAAVPATPGATAAPALPEATVPDDRHPPDRVPAGAPA
jgi:EmrB/QacA subfamily drug resistance transporter